MTLTAAQKLAKNNLRRWRADPVAFARECLRADEIDDWEQETLEAATQHKRIALKASKGPGKSAKLAWIVWWFIATRTHPKIVCTSISGDNLRDGLWAELSKWQQRSAFLKEAFRWQAERLSQVDHPETWFASARQWSKSADPTQQANTLAGIHADNVLFVVDEAGGVPDAVVAAAEAGLANADKEVGREALLVIAGNPTELSGPLYRACTTERHLWWVKEISGDPDDPKRAKRVSIEWAREQKQKYGADHPFYLVNVLGKFPPAQSNTLLGLEDCQAAARRIIPPRDYQEEVRIIGLDVARFGDDRSVLTKRQGRMCFPLEVRRNWDTMQVAGWLISEIEAWQPDAVFVDSTGVGAGVVDRCLEQGYSVVGVESAGKPITGGAYLNRRAEMYDLTKAWVLGGGGLPPEDGELVTELCSPTYRFDSSGKLVLESKADMKKRGVPSPDKADSLTLTFAAPVASRQTRERMGGHVAGRPRAYDPFAKLY